MTRSRLPLLAFLPVAIVASTFLLGSSIAVQACPLTDGGMNLNMTLGQPDVSHLSAVVRPSGESNRPSLDYMGVAGLGGVAGLFAIALIHKVRRSRSVAPSEAEFLRRYPQLEHPELALTLIPQEALPSNFDTEFSVR